MRKFDLLLSVLACCVLADSSEEVEVVAHLKLRNLETLNERFWSISNVESQDYAEFLTVTQISDIISPEDSHINKVKQWFVSMGSTSQPILSNLRDTVTAKFNREDISERELHLAKPEWIAFLVVRHSQNQVVSHEDKKEKTNRKFNSSALENYDVGSIKDAYGIPRDLAASNSSTLQMVWGPGTFGFSRAELTEFKYLQCPSLNLSKIVFDTKNHGVNGGDNYGEGNLDVKMISAFGLNVETLVSNTNASTSTEEGNGFGQALLDFLTSLASRSELPHVLSLSLGSLSATSCDMLCQKAGEAPYNIAAADCKNFLQNQRQVCMFLSPVQTMRIDTALQVLGTRGVSVFGSSGDGGSHFSFGPFNDEDVDEAESSRIATALNKISCTYQFPVFPTASPYIVSVGGEMWSGGDSSKPITWAGFGGGSGGGFSWQFPMPAHQSDGVTTYLSRIDLLPPAMSFNASGRGYPDISGIAVDGTSQSSPLVAGIFSLIMDARLNAGLGRLGFVAPRIWKVAKDFPGEAFEDIPEGDSKTTCESGFKSMKGSWDPNTGWGRPVWKGLIEHFASDDMTLK